MALLTVEECFYEIRNGANIKQGIVDGGYPITRIETLSDDKFNRDRMGYAGITNIDQYKDYVLCDGDLLMSHINSPKYLGRTVMYRAEEEETIIHGMNLLRLKARRDIVEPAFAELLFYSPRVREQIGKITKKSVNQASFSVSDLKKIKVDIPSLEEQRSIVEKIDKLKTILGVRRTELEQLELLIKARFVEMFGDPDYNSMEWSEVAF
jgi:type I restriction enzyme S subunit